MKKTVVIIGIFLALYTGNAGVRAVSAPETIPNAQQPEEWQELQVHYIDVGQGDSTLLICGGQAMLIDAGNNNKGTTVQLYLQKQGIDALDYVVGTHPDAAEESEADMMVSGLSLQAQVLKVGHHGSSSSTSKAFTRHPTLTC